MYKSSDTPFLPFIEAQYAIPRLAVYLKCLPYSQIRIDVDPHIMEDKHWITQVKALIKDHYLNWQRRHQSELLALNTYQPFMGDSRSVCFSVLTRAGFEEPQVVTGGINDEMPANPTLTDCRGGSLYQIC